MNTSTVNISFRRNLLTQIDQIAREESRSRSELIREAARIYIERKEKWENIFKFGKRQTSKLGLSKKDIFEEITKYREQKS